MTFNANLATQRQMIEALRDPARYPHRVAAVSVIETHISFVLLTGLFAYKIKKAVDLGFVDYTSLELRRFFCEEELRLNRRLAPRLYLDVTAIGGTAEDPYCDGGGEPIEYAVKMREFDQQDLLDHVLTQGGLTLAQMDTLATMLAAFHKTAPAADLATVYGNPETLWAPLETNFAYFRTQPDANHRQLAALEAWCQAEFFRLQDSFVQRKAAGWIRECHGDLHLGNLALYGGEPLAFDCIEFNPALRWIDVISDLAFLVMDLSVHGRPDYAWRHLNDWLEDVGDYAGLELLRFYQVYRALVRAMVASLRAADNTLSAPARHAAQVRSAAYLDYASANVMPRPRAVLITHGFSGSGKSTLSCAAAATLNAVRLRSDIERKRLHDLPPRARSGSGLDAGIYAESATLATYQQLATLAAAVLGAGYPVIVDAAGLQHWQRQLFCDLARQAGVPFLILDCHAPEALLLQRVDTRAHLGNDASEATRVVLARQCRDAEPLPPEERKQTLIVDTTEDNISTILTEILQRIGPASE